MKRKSRADPWKRHCGGMHCGNVAVGSDVLTGCQCSCGVCEKSRPYPTAEERTDDAIALRERVKVLEGHRQMWWRRAWYLHGIVAEHDRKRADEIVEDWDREEPTQ